MSPTDPPYRRRVGRRTFVKMGAVAAGSVAAGCSLAEKAARLQPSGAGDFGRLVPDDAGLLDLPRGFQYRVLSEEGATLSDGSPVPGDHDGMGAFAGRDGTTILVRNHELGSGEDPATEGRNPYDPDAPGGTTAVVVGPDRRELESYVTSSGSLDNCAGGATPWGTWLTCEETSEDGHGYVFEVVPDDPENGLARTPIRAMGYFSHEAAGVDPATGIVYLTEDEGPTSFLYRYIPHDATPRPGALQKGGTLQALGIHEQGASLGDATAQGRSFTTRWVDVDPEHPHDDADDGDAVRFKRLEGADFAGGVLWFNDTSGGDEGLGQTFRYTPATNALELFFESTRANEMNSPDNAEITPWGDFFFVEDASDGCRIMGTTPEGTVYEFGFNRRNDSEFAGPCFSPDGKTMFVNVQEPGMTVAIWGPFKARSAARRRRMGLAAPPAIWAPRLTDAIVEAAEREALTPLQAAAYDRLGIPLLG